MNGIIYAPFLPVGLYSKIRHLGAVSKRYLLHNWPDSDEVAVVGGWYTALCNYQARSDKWRGIIPIDCIFFTPGIKYGKSVTAIIKEAVLLKSKEYSIIPMDGREFIILPTTGKSYIAPDNSYFLLKLKLFPHHYWRGKIVKP